MNTANIERYAPQARDVFVAAIIKQAVRYGVTAQGITPIELRPIKIRESISVLA